MTILLGAWVMLFAALFLAYGVVRVQANEWPPFGAPRLPLRRARAQHAAAARVERGAAPGPGARAARRRRERCCRRRSSATLLGAGFLGAQIAIWRSMLARGLFPSSGVYGSVFYALTGFHALHVLGGVVALALLAIQAARARRASRAPLRALRLTALYWDFVAIVWVAMYRDGLLAVSARVKATGIWSLPLAGAALAAAGIGVQVARDRRPAADHRTA